MTDLGYGPAPSTAAPATWRVVMVVMVTLLAPPAALLAAFVAVVTWSGCFIGCSSAPNHAGGGLLAILAVLLLVSGPVLARLLLKKRVAVGWSVLGVVAVLVVTVFRLGAF